jgi:hypothetical protein
MNEIIVNGVTYVPKQQAELSNIKMVRSYGAGVFFGEVIKETYESGVLIVEMVNARRVWYWDGSASLSQLATEGTSAPENCKFPCEVPHVKLVNVIEILTITDKALKSLKAVKVWQK